MKVGLIGNPNVGKSTIFNALTGMHQHTGNWPGKTVEKCLGVRFYNGTEYEIDDLPGTYSLMSHSKEEEVTRDFVYFGDYDALVIVCDACALERNLNLVMQILEVTSNVVVCVNLMDEAKKKGIVIDFDRLRKSLGVPIIPSIARSKKGIYDILDSLNNLGGKTSQIDYDFLNDVFNYFDDYIPYSEIPKRLVGMHIMLGDNVFLKNYDYNFSTNLSDNYQIKSKALKYLKDNDFTYGDIESIVSECISLKCADICSKCVSYTKDNYDKRDRFIDRIVTSKFTGSIIMIFLLFLVLWITIVFANYPSDFLYNLFFSFEKYLLGFLNFLHIPTVIVDALVYGVYRVLAWVVAVMLPPMMIFFPMFTILEDLGYLPRIAFNLDGVYYRCGSCGKQALTMIEGFGCNAVGVTGARIIDSPRERLIAILTNSFVPCNGRFPLLISLISMFVISSSLFGSITLTLFILIGIVFTFIISKLLSKTILKGVPSSFTLELPPYRRPQFIKVIVRSVFDRSLFVLKRAVMVSAPAGLLIWILANTYVGDNTLLGICTNFLEPFGVLIGLDGVILMAFLLGFPANEIVIPIMIMGYMSLGYITDMSNLNELKELFISNGWTVKTAICTMLFSILHFPCMTTLLTVKKETGSFKWMILSFLIPLFVGTVVCLFVNLLF